MNRVQKEKARAVILAVLDTAGRPMKAAEIAADPKARRIGTRSVGQLLKDTHGVTYDRAAKKWSHATKKQVVTVVKESARVARVVSDAAFTGIAFSRSRQQIVFKIGEAEFPFTVID